MKKLLSLLAFASVMAACNDSANDAASNTDSAATQMESTPAATDTSSAASTDANMKDGVMTMKDGKMMVMNAGKWEPMTNAFTCTNGRKVEPNGDVSKGGKKRKLEEGMMIDKDGQMMDKDGKMMDNTGWE